MSHGSLTRLDVMRVLRAEPFGVTFDDALAAMREARACGRAVVHTGSPDENGREPGALISALDDGRTRFSVRAVTIALFDAPLTGGH